MRLVWKSLKILSFATAILVIGSFLTVWIFSLYRPAIQKSDAIIVLGAAINTPALYNRTLEGLQLYQQGKAPVLILSGGRISNEDISEAQYMQKVINKNSSTSVATILDQDSHTTYENIEDAKADDPSAKSVIIVSDNFHLARGVLVAERAGFHPVSWSSPDESAYKKSELAFYFFRETMALISYIPKLIFG